jgi:hypothetical protein
MDKSQWEPDQLRAIRPMMRRPWDNSYNLLEVFAVCDICPAPSPRAAAMLRGGSLQHLEIFHMYVRATCFLALVVAGASAGVTGCGGSDPAPTTTSSTTTTSTSSATTSTGMGGAGGAGGGAADPCIEICSNLYDCGAGKGADMMKHCVGYEATDEEKTLFLEGDPEDPMDGCVYTCGQQPALAALVDPSNCGKTVSTLKGLNPTYKDTCENGIGNGAGGGGGAGSGGGGAGSGGGGGN